MKNVFLLIPLFLTQLALGQLNSEQIVSGTPLLTIMKTMNADLSKIEKQVNDSSKNQSSMFLAEGVAKYIIYAKEVPPEKALDPSKPGNDLAFNGMIDGLSASFGDLAAAFKENENAKAAEIVSQIMSIKPAGHGIFKKKWYE